MAEATNKKLKAVLIGATGATGKYLFAELIKAKEFSEIVTLGRRKTTITPGVTGINLEEEEASGRVKQAIVDFADVSNETVGEYFTDTDVFFSTFGTSRDVVKSDDDFRRIDCDYNVNFAKVAKENGVRVYSLLSSLGAKQNSWILYFNSKGKLEHECSLLEFPKYSIFRPGVLGQGSEARFREKLYGFFFTLLETTDLARGMLFNALGHLNAEPNDKPQQFLYDNTEIREMSKQYLEK